MFSEIACSSTQSRGRLGFETKMRSQVTSGIAVVAMRIAAGVNASVLITPPPFASASARLSPLDFGLMFQ